MHRGPRDPLERGGECCGPSLLVAGQPATQTDQDGAHVIRDARAITFQLAEVAITGPMVRTMAPRSTPKLNESGRTVPSAALKNTAAEPEHGGLAV